MLVGVHSTKLPTDLFDVAGLGSLIYLILLTDAYGDSGWVGNKCIIAYGRHGFVGFIN